MDKIRGASELQFVTAEGKDGGYQNHFRVYAQQNKLCQRCKSEKIEKYFLGGRGTYSCPKCQK
jgi:Formamidopyrimidine-DNA glycosylase